MIESALQQRGASLRAEVAAIFGKLRASREGIGPGNGPGQDVSATVTEFIPVGTPLDDAIAILRAGAFDLAPPPPRPISFPGSELTRFDVLAGLTLEQGAFYKITLSIVLDPEVAGDTHTSVKAVHATIIHSAI